MKIPKRTFKVLFKIFVCSIVPIRFTSNSFSMPDIFLNRNALLKLQYSDRCLLFIFFKHYNTSARITNMSACLFFLQCKRTIPPYRITLNLPLINVYFLISCFTIYFSKPSLSVSLPLSLS